MIEIAADLFKTPGGYDAVCITTNGAIRKDGAAVMGRGVALQAKTRWPGVEFLLGNEIRRCGNQVNILTSPACRIDEHLLLWHLVALPVKHHWRELANRALIVRSLEQLILQADARGWTRVALPRPGCGNGGLDWKQHVRPSLVARLDDRFHVFNIGTG